MLRSKQGCVAVRKPRPSPSGFLYSRLYRMLWWLVDLFRNVRRVMVWGQMQRISLGFLMLALLTGCTGEQPYMTEHRLRRGLVIVLTGIEGRSVFNEAICKGLDDGGVDWGIELRDWTSPLGPLYNLHARQRNRRKATELADRIVRYQLSYPDRPVVLVGQSGGGAIAIWATEALPHNRRADGVILLAATISRQYMLDGALRNSRRGVLNFFSFRDWLLIGTQIAGTMDGQRGPSAGRLGFHVPVAGGRPRVYDKLFQIGWSPRMSETGHEGGHLTSGAARFVATYVAPLVLADEWSDDVIARVWNQEPVTIAPSSTLSP